MYVYCSRYLWMTHIYHTNGSNRLIFSSWFIHNYDYFCTNSQYSHSILDSGSANCRNFRYKNLFFLWASFQHKNNHITRAKYYNYTQSSLLSLLLINHYIKYSDHSCYTQLNYYCYVSSLYHWFWIQSQPKEQKEDRDEGNNKGPKRKRTVMRN